MFRAVMLSAMALCAQSGDWAQVQALAPGAQVEVKRFSGGGEVRGTLASASGEGLVVTWGKQDVTVARADVRRVRLRSEKRGKAGRITGAIVGGALGAPCALICDTSAGGRAAVIPVYAGLGYLIGWATDRHKRIVIYKARKA
jgi:hypothetical protein